MNSKKISIYARNFNIDPSTYYGIVCVNRAIKEFQFRYRCLIPDNLFVELNKKHWNGKLTKYIRYCILGVVTLLRATVFFFDDQFFFRPNVVYVNRDIFPHYTPALLLEWYKELLAGRDVIWRFDDNIFIHEITKQESSLLMEKSRSIAAGNEYLKSIVPEEYRHKLLPVFAGQIRDPDIDLQKVEKAAVVRAAQYEQEVCLIWLGSASGMSSLQEVLPAMESAAEKLQHIKKLRLVVVSDRPLEAGTKYLIIKNVKWTRSGAIEELYKAHIGLMPLPDSDFSRGKSAFKITQYKCSGIPTIASDLPIHKAKLKNGDGIIVPFDNYYDNWCQAVINLSNEKTRWENMARIAQIDVRKDFASEEEISDRSIRIYNNEL